MVLIPIPFFLEQIWLLLLSIAIEAIIIQQQLQLRRKTSIEYAAIINIFSCIILSLACIIGYNFFNNNFKLQIVEYLLWRRINFFQDFNQIVVFLIVASIYFLINVYIELQIMNLLQNIILSELSESNIDQSELTAQPILLQVFNIYGKPQQLKAVIFANFGSLTILIILHYCFFYLF